MEKIELPKDWKWVKLREYVISVKGKKPKRVSKEKTKECSIPYVNIKAFEKNIIDEYTDGVGCALCEDGDFLMVWDGSRSGYVGKAIKGALGSTLVKLNFPDIENNYAYYFLQSKFIEINTRAKGVGIPHVDPNILWNYDLLIPPKFTQQAIVSKIEELFSEIENGIKSLLTARRQLKTYRQSVLKWAFEGKLTNENVKDGELPEGWKWITLREIADQIFDGPFGSNLKSVDYIKEGVRVIRLENIGVLTFKDEYKTFVSNEKYLSIQKHTVRSGDIIFSSFIIGEVRVVVLPKFIKKAINKADCFCIRLSPKIVDNNYLAYFLSTKNIYNQLVEGVHGATRPRINTTQLKSCLVPYCSIEEQHKIVQAIESRFSVADKMEESINQSLQQAEALKQSILKKAFEGRII
jgi:type I restriction enzyme, S subunit